MKTKKGTVPNYRITIVPDGVEWGIGLFTFTNWFMSPHHKDMLYDVLDDRIHCIGYKTNQTTMRTTATILFILLLISLSGCGPKFHLRQAKKHIFKAESLGAKWQTDTVYVNTRVPLPEIRQDSIIISKPGDTVVISKDRLLVKYVRLQGDTVFIDAACLPDTVLVNVPVTVTKVIEDPHKTPWWWWLIVLAVGFVVGVFVQRR